MLLIDRGHAIRAEIMGVTPKRSGHEAPAGGRYPSEVLADNLRGYRALKRLKQEDLAEGMCAAGHVWRRATVSEVERGGRAVDVDELVSLAMVLGVTVGNLLDPAGPDGSRSDGLFVGSAESERRVVPQPQARAIAYSVTPVAWRQMRLLPDDRQIQLSLDDEEKFEDWLAARGARP